MNHIIYKLPVIKQIHALHLLIDEQRLEVENIRRENAAYQRRIFKLEKEKITRTEFKNTMSGIRKELQYNFFKGLPQQKYEEALCEWYYCQTGERLHLDHPKTFNEKIQWLKLYDSSPLKTRLADKIAVREWVREKAGEQYLVPCYGVWDCFEEIDFNKMPDQFVLKASHGCGWNVIVKKKDEFDKDEARRKFQDWLGRNYAWYGLELQYKDIPPKIYAEKYIENENDLYDYKFLCFNGQIRYVQVITERSTQMHMTIYDAEWIKQDFSIGWPPSERDPAKPESFDEMKRIVQKLCEGFLYVRVDLYDVEGRVYFGEMTFTSGNGKYRFEPVEYNAVLGEMITLPDIKE